MRDTLALVLVNLTSVCWLPGAGNRPQTVRSASAAESATAFVSQHTQRYDLHVYRTANTANFGKRPGGATRFSMRTIARDRSGPTEVARISSATWSGDRKRL